MCIWHKFLLSIVLGVAAAGAATAAPYPGIGRTATPAEVAAWDIDVRPDFKGLPAGSGTVAQGMVVWESKCASCHGIFGESNEVFSPLVGGTTREDVKSGRVVTLSEPGYPGRSTLMKLSTLSTLWDTIRRAMPWNAPKSLTVAEVYAVTAYLLNLGGVVGENFTLSQFNIAQVQLPNRHGKTTDHGLWPGSSLGNGGVPDVKAAACMHNCLPAQMVSSFIPDHARNDHGNLAEQNRTVGAQRGLLTAAPSPPAPALVLAKQHNCLACHGLDKAIVGPALSDVAQKYARRVDVEYLAGKIRAGSSGVWGNIPMPPQTLPEADAKLIAQWLAGGLK